jgi:ornithine cyclodeaminase/alanine dehydrogenase-like protein (mu-crystallin family)
MAGACACESHVCGRAIKNVLVHNPTKTNRENFAAEIGQELGIPVEAVISGESVANGADILVAATNSVSRVVPPEWLKPGMHITNVKITELGEETFKKADRLVIHGNSPRKIILPAMAMRKLNVMTR